MQQRIAGNQNGRELPRQIKAAHVGFEKLDFNACSKSFRPRGIQHGCRQIGADDLDSALCDRYGQPARSTSQFQYAAAAFPRFFQVEPFGREHSLPTRFILHGSAVTGTRKHQVV